jgi:hypothetical protein
VEQERSNQISDLAQDVLAVVQEEQRLPGTQIRLKRGGDRGVRSRGHAHCGRDRGAHQHGIGKRCEIDPHHPIGEVVSYATGNGQRQARLADPTRSGQR